MRKSSKTTSILYMSNAVYERSKVGKCCSTKRNVRQLVTFGRVTSPIPL